MTPTATVPSESPRRADTALAAWLVLLPVLWLPWLGTFTLAKAALAWVGAWLSLALPTGAAPRGWPTAAKLLALAFAAALPAFLLRTADVTAGLDRLALDAALLATLAVLARRGAAGPALDRLLDAAVLGAALAAGLDLLAGLAGGALPALADRPPFGNPMIAGAHAAVAVPLALARAQVCAAAGERRRAAWRFAGAALLLVAVGAGGSLGAVAAAVAGALTVAVTSAPRPGRRALAVGLAAALALAALALTPAARRVAADHLAGRAWGWHVAAAAVREAPLLGHGPGDWPAAFYEAQGRRVAARPGDVGRWTSEQRPHATLPGRAVEDGLPAAALLAVALLAGLAGALRRRAPAAGAWVALAVTTLYAFPLRSPPTALLLPLLLLAAAPPAPPRARRWPGPRLARAALAAAGALLVAWGGLRVTGDALRVAGHPQAALRLNPTDPEAAFAAGVAALAAAQPAEAEALLARSLERRPGLAAALMAGNAALAAGDLDAAERWYATALRWHPAYSLALHNRAWVAALGGDLVRARALAAEAVRRNPDNPALRPLRELLRE